MIITLTGANSFGLGAELRALVAGFVKEHGDLALEQLDGTEVDFGRIQEALTSLPFLASKKMVVLRDPSKSKQFLEQAEQLFSELPETTEVIAVEPKLDKRLAYYKYLKKGTDFREFNELDLNGLAQWLVQAAKAKDGSISLADARYLVERVGANQQLLSNELEKLLLYADRHPEQSEGSQESLQISKVTWADIDLLTDPTPQSKIFDLLDAAFAGNTKRTLELYAEQRAQKVEPQIIISMLTWQLHQVALVKAGGQRSVDEVAREAKVSPYSLGKSGRIASKLTLAELKHLIGGLLTIDTRSKRESIDLDEALQHYLLMLA